MKEWMKRTLNAKTLLAAVVGALVAGGFLGPDWSAFVQQMLGTGTVLSSDPYVLPFLTKDW